MSAILDKIQSVMSLPARLPGVRTVFCFLSLCSLPSCMENEGVEYASFLEVGYDGMPESWEFEFSPAPADSASFDSVPFDVILVVRYSAVCKARNLPLRLEEFSLQQDLPDTLYTELPLFNAGNEPAGRGNYSIYETADTIRKGMKIPLGYTISISSPLPQAETAGVRSVGVVLSRTGSAGKFNLF